MSGEASGLTLVVDARGLHASGIGRYLREVLLRVFDDPRFARVTLVGRLAELDAFVRARRVRAATRLVKLEHGFYSPGVQLRWLALRARGELRGDVAFFPHYDVPLTHGSMRTVVTVQDLSHFRLPELFPAWKRALARPVLERAVRRATRVLVTSAATARDLVQAHPGAEPRMQVIPLGVDARFTTSVEPQELAVAQALRPYLLCVGNRKPHKNLGVAVEVLAKVRERHPGVRLVLVGKHFTEGDAVAERSAALGVGDAVVELGAVDDARLRAVYSQAACLLFPSLYEGFGLPVLEAMAAGVPVVASDRASIPEVLGDAGFLADPHDAGAMAHAAERLLCEPGLRDEMVRRGRARAARFSWHETAARTADVLAEAGADARAHRVPAGAPRA